MPVKTTGAELMRFYNDDTFWPKDAYHEDAIITVNGVEQPDGVGEVKDTDEITIAGGYVMDLNDGKREPSLESFFKRWKKQQSIGTFLVECELENIEAVKAAVRAAGARVK